MIISLQTRKLHTMSNPSQRISAKLWFLAELCCCLLTRLKAQIVCHLRMVVLCLWAPSEKRDVSPAFIGSSLETKKTCQMKNRFFTGVSFQIHACFELWTTPNHSDHHREDWGHSAVLFNILTLDDPGYWYCLCYECMIYNVKLHRKSAYDGIGIFHDRKGIPPDNQSSGSESVSGFSENANSIHQATFHYETHPKCLSSSRGADDVRVSVDLQTRWRGSWWLHVLKGSPGCSACCTLHAAKWDL